MLNDAHQDLPLRVGRDKERQREYNRAYRAANKERLAADQKRWRHANPDNVKRSAARYRAGNATAIKESHIKYTYGLSTQEYADLLTKAGNACEICDKQLVALTEDVPLADKACVDHDHATGRVRGILCHSCNRQLAFFEQHQSRAAAYLK